MWYMLNGSVKSCTFFFQQNRFLSQGNYVQNLSAIYLKLELNENLVLLNVNVERPYFVYISNITSNVLHIFQACWSL